MGAREIHGGEKASIVLKTIAREVLASGESANKGDARRILTERTRDAEMCRRAIDDFEAVAQVFHEASHAQYYDLAKERVAVARKLAVELST